MNELCSRDKAQSFEFKKEKKSQPRRKRYDDELEWSERALEFISDCPFSNPYQNFV